MPNRFASVLVDVSLDRENKCFDYEIGDDIAPGLVCGMRVMVPFGPRDIEGFVLDIKDSTEIPKDKIKKITKMMDDFPAIKPDVLSMLDEICDKFKLRKIDVLRLFIPGSLRGRKRKRKAKNVEVRAREVEDKKVLLTDEQEFAVGEILNSNGEVFVLHGVTGSGKTEVYMNVISRMLDKGKTAIMLVPEIGLTPQMLGNFRQKFGDSVAVLHSGLTVGERYDEWYRLYTGEAKIAIGARSAIFAPLDNIGVVIIDEEHDTSYFSESNPRFCTHDIAKIRAKYWGGCVVLGSATPSTSTFHKARQGEYRLLTLSRRVNDLPMPNIELIDMTAQMRAGNSGLFSDILVKKLKENIANKKQSIIFLNRRGFSSSVMCKNCGWVARCEHCDVSLVYHKDDAQLKCHYCSARFTAVSSCPTCQSKYLKFGSTGTQKVVDDVKAMFPDVKVFRMDADSIKTKDDLINLLDDFGNTKPSILVGTQMIAKGHHFPDVTLVGIIDADNSLHFSDFRASERTFALITQVAGRCGRQNGDGYVILQSLMPKHYVYKMASEYDYLKFFEKELSTRQGTKYPPFTTIARILVTGERDDKIKDMLQKIMGDLRERAGDFIYLGAMKSPLGRIDDKFRYQVLCRFKCDIEKDMLSFIDTAVRKYQPKSVQVFLEINPQSLS